MKSEGLLFDTCAWVEYFKPRSSSLKQTVEDLLLTEEVYVCGPVLYELRQGVKSDKEKTLLANAFAALVYVEMNESLWFKAGELSALVKKARPSPCRTFSSRLSPWNTTSQFLR